ncbi:MAG: glycosyltransferase family 2 protein [Muribaculaceae bacterium]|nr:glycosyltransferase family 2 protein [Muribaculaceae bacterium]
MKVSIIIPVYNRAQVVQRTLGSVAQQTHRPLQVVLVDNCSTDGSLAVLEDFSREHSAPDFEVLIVQEAHHTAGAARNRGLEVATCEWVLFFDSDDVMRPRLVERYVHEIERHEGELDLISTRSRVVFPDESTLELPFARRDIIAFHLLHSQLATQRYAVRRAFFAATDGWNINLPGWNDWEMGMRLLLARPRLAFMGGQIDVEVYHSGNDSITGTEFHSRQGQWERVIDIVETEVHCSSLKNRRRYLRLLDYRRLVLAAQYEREGYPQLAKLLCKRAFNSLRESYDGMWQWRWVVSPALKWMFGRIVAGKRGSARIAQLLLR